MLHYLASKAITQQFPCTAAKISLKAVLSCTELISEPQRLPLLLAPCSPCCPNTNLEYLFLQLLGAVVIQDINHPEQRLAIRHHLHVQHTLSAL